jgi:hypothetical protein
LYENLPFGVLYAGDSGFPEKFCEFYIAVYEFERIFGGRKLVSCQTVRREKQFKIHLIAFIQDQMH